jgi:hypothetical protein
LPSLWPLITALKTDIFPCPKFFIQQSKYTNAFSDLFHLTIQQWCSPKSKLRSADWISYVLHRKYCSWPRMLWTYSYFRVKWVSILIAHYSLFIKRT